MASVTLLPPALCPTKMTREIVNIYRNAHVTHRFQSLVFYYIYRNEKKRKVDPKYRNRNYRIQYLYKWVYVLLVWQGGHEIGQGRLYCSNEATWSGSEGSTPAPAWSRQVTLWPTLSRRVPTFVPAPGTKAGAMHEHKVGCCHCCVEMRSSHIQSL